MSKTILSILILLISFTCLSFADTIVNNIGGAAAVETHVCTEEDKSVKICPTNVNHVCGDNKVTYPSGCNACKAAGVTKYTAGTC